MLIVAKQSLLLWATISSAIICLFLLGNVSKGTFKGIKDVLLCLFYTLLVFPIIFLVKLIFKML